MTESTVEKYLNTVSYDVPKDYVPSDFAIGFVNFIKLVNGEEGEENLTPIVHYRMLDTIAEENKRIANMCSRGLAKTTIFGEYLILYCGVYRLLPVIGEVDFALYVSDSIENGVKNMRKNLEHRWENSDFLQEFIPKIKFTDIRWEFCNAENESFVVRGYGASTGVRGAKEHGTRPQLAILDDLVSDEDARSATVISSIEDTVYKAVNYALHPKKNMVIWSGTPFNARDPLYKAVESGAWKSNVFPICEEFPCSKKEFRGAWPDRFNYDYVKEEYDRVVSLGKVNTFNQEMMLRIMSEEDRLINDSEIMWYKHSSVLNHRSRYNFYITTDFATSESQASDYSVISVWALNHVGYWFWVDGILKRQTMDKNVDDLFRLSQLYKPQSVGIEVSGQQGGFIKWVQGEMETRNIYFNLASENNNNNPGIRPNTNKMVRFNLMVPIIKARKMYFPTEMKEEFILQEAMNEIRLVSPGGMKSKKDDFLDTISMLASLNTWKPSAELDLVPSSDGSGVWELDIVEDDDNAYSSYVV